MDTLGDNKDWVFSTVCEWTAGSKVGRDGGIAPRIEFAIDKEEAREVFDDSHVPAIGVVVDAGFGLVCSVVCEAAWGGWEVQTALALKIFGCYETGNYAGNILGRAVWRLLAVV